MEKLNTDLIQAIEEALTLAEKVQKERDSNSHLDVVRLREAKEVAIARGKFLKAKAEKEAAAKKEKKEPEKKNDGKEGEKPKA